MNTGLACPFCGEELGLLSTHSDDKYVCGGCAVRFSERMLELIGAHAAKLKEQLDTARELLQEKRDIISRLRHPDTTGQ